MTREEKQEYMKQWRKLNREKIYQKHKLWRDKNREHLNEMQRIKYKKNPEMFKNISKKYRETHIEQEKERHHKYKINNRKKVAEYERYKREEPLYKLKSNIRTLIKNSLRYKTHKSNTKTEKLLGCSYDYFIKYLQSLFKEGMTLENHGLWHIDHIIPISSAKNEEELIKLNHYTNFQPLWAEENLRKGNKII